MDHVTQFLERFPPRADHLFSGDICGRSPTYYAGPAGYLHFLQEGILTLSQDGAAPLVIAEPALIFCPGPYPHHLDGDTNHHARMLCAVISFGPGSHRLLQTYLPDVIVLPLSTARGLDTVLKLLMQEAQQRKEGWKSATDRLFEYVVAVMIRQHFQDHPEQAARLEGFGDARLSKVLNALHDAPNADWTLARLSSLAGMSRASFAARFHEILGASPISYLAQARMTLAARHLLRGSSIKQVASTCGFRSQAAFTRCFSRHFGKSPSAWLAEH